ncbi:sugar lactone lactonase YvrE [Kushneria sinocarnis]|uniref:Sugar lactone lactonase YvrE n=1 Tax=Kushneria sinocarnis TaxID=595502 RepID=A0A420WSW8_9GAMM|nr:SMP-30/gluconolactonase/LRE family protein [Kushneria sinocarnis]RKQ95704.1 sugar lactone lactonase YvrE [Kushneria sinocarnis]
MSSLRAVECEVLVEGLEIPECPVWHAPSQSLFFVDIPAGTLNRWHHRERRRETWPLPEPLGCFALIDEHRFIVGLASGLYWFDTRTEQLAFLHDPEPGKHRNRINDGKVGADGHFWFGTMNHDGEPEAGLYRFSPEGECQTVLTGLKTSNGLAWSTDGRRVFHSDSRGQYVQCFDYDEHGEPGEPRRLCQLGEADGRPDGAAMDCRDRYWSAGVSASWLNLLDGEGRRLERIQLPWPKPSMPCFGGPDMTTVFVTQLATEQSPGRLIVFEGDSPGTEVPAFQPRFTPPA